MIDGKEIIHYSIPMHAQPARLKVSDKGQVTLRRSLLDHVGARPGDTLELVPLPGNRLEVRAAKTGSIEAFFGSIKNDGSQPLSIEEMNAIIADGWAGKL